MRKEEIVALGIDEEKAVKIVEMAKKDLDGYVPKERFDTVNKAKKDAEELLTDRDNQLEKLKKNAGDKEALEKQIETLQSENKTANEKYQADIKKMKVDFAVDKAIAERHGLNSTAIKALLTGLDEAEFNDDGTVKGLSAQLDSLVAGENSKMLFGNGTVQIKGLVPGANNQKPTGVSDDDLSKMSYSELSKYLEENPDVTI